MVFIINKLSHLGASSLHFFWIPLAIWTFFSLLTILSLRKFKKLHPAYQYHIRLSLLVSLPFGFASWTFVNHYLVPEETFHGVLPQQIMVLLSPVTVNQTVTSPAAFNLTDKNFWLGVLFFILILISLTGLSRLLLNYYRLHRFRKKLTLKSFSDYSNLDTSVKELSIKCRRNIRLAFTDQPQIPFTFGWLKPVIVLPRFLLREPKKLNLALLHELTHIKRHDYLLNGFMKIVSSIFLFHPLIHIISREIDEYNEMSCDTEVMDDDKISSKEYAYLLYELMHLPVLHSMTGMSMANSSSNIKKRIQAMTKYKSKRRSVFLQTPLLFLITFGITMLMACSGLQNQDTSGKKLLDQKMTFSSPSVTINGNQVMSSEMGAKFQGQALGIIYLETPKYGSFLISGQSFDGAKPVGSINGKTLSFKINEMNVNIKSVSNILPSKNATVWVKNNANITTKKSYQMGWAENLDKFHKIISNQSHSGPHYTMKNDKKLYVVTDKMPVLIGGLKSIMSRVQYPETAKKAGIEGRVYVQFIVDKQGNVVDPKVVKGIGAECDKAALEAVKQAHFKPGYKNGKPVQVKYAIPVVFSLGNNTSH